MTTCTTETEQELIRSIDRNVKLILRTVEILARKYSPVGKALREAMQERQP